MKKNNIDFIAFISAFSIHLIIGGVLLMNVDFDLPQDKPKKEVSIIKASVVNQKTFDDLAELKAEEKREAQRIKDEARKKKEREEAEKARKAALLKKKIEDRIAAEKAEAVRQELEAKRIKAEKALAAKKLQEKKAADALAAKKLKEKKAAEKKEAQRIQAEKAKAEKIAKEKKAAKDKAIKEAKVKAAKEKAIKEAEIKAAKDKAEKEAKIKAAKEKAIKEAERKAAEEAAEQERLRQAELDRQMEAEFSEDFSDEKNAKKLSEIEKYEALIRGKISRYWNVDASMDGKSCTLDIRLASDGFVISVTKIRGHEQLCKSARSAAFKAKSFALPKDPEIALEFKDLRITLTPDSINKE